jgi:hypothetical protein
MSSVSNKYISLITSFIDGDIPVCDFEKQYLDMFKNETDTLSEIEYEALDFLFSSVDVFCADDDLRDDDDIDEKQLLDDARITLSKLRKG